MVPIMALIVVFIFYRQTLWLKLDGFGRFRVKQWRACGGTAGCPASRAYPQR
jgi:hypothetical protein